MASQHGWQQLWMPETFSLLTLPWGTWLSAFIASCVLPVSPWKPAAARASRAFWAPASSLAVRVAVPFSMSQWDLTPSTPFSASYTPLTQPSQQRWTPFSSTVVSVRFDGCMLFLPFWY